MVSIAEIDEATDTSRNRTTGTIRTLTIKMIRTEATGIAKVKTTGTLMRETTNSLVRREHNYYKSLLTNPNASAINKFAFCYQACNVQYKASSKQLF